MENNTHTENKTSRIDSKSSNKSINLNIWQISSFVLLAVLLITLFFSFSNKTTGNVISEVEAGKKIMEFVNKQTAGQGTAELISTVKEGNLFKSTIKFNDQEIPVYATLDGEFLIPQLIPLSEGAANQQTAPQAQDAQSDTPANVPKSDKPNVELFVMSHCPYGTQMEKGILPVVKELGSNIDFEIKFVNYAMHPTQGEVEEQLNQYCIQKEQNAKYLDYLSCFLGEGNGDACLKEVKIDEVKLKACTDKTDNEFDVLKNLEDKSSWASGRFPKFMINDADNQKYGVQGSPTLVINGVQAESGRDAQSLLNTICSAFTTQPEGCNTDMTSFGNPAPGFGFDTQGGSASAAGCGV